MYIRDPSGNLVEVDWPDVTTLDPELVAEFGRLEDDVPQEGEARTATLYARTSTVSNAIADAERTGGRAAASRRAVVRRGPAGVALIAVAVRARLGAVRGPHVR